MKRRLTFIFTFFAALLIVSSLSFAKQEKRDVRISKNNDSKNTNVVKTEDHVAENNTVPKNSDHLPTVQNIILSPALTNTPAAPMTGEQIKWQVLSSGGTQGSSTNFMISGTVGQTAIGLSASTNFQVYSGYWQNFTNGSGGCCFDVRGNIDNNPNPDVAGVGGVDIADLVYLVAFSFGGGPAPVCTEESDLDASGGAIPIDIADIVYLVSFMFSGGPAPLSCT